MNEQTEKQVFHQSNSGHHTDTLSREDVSVASVRLLGYKPSKFELNDMMGSKEGEVNEEMPLARFVEVMTAKLKTVDEDEEIRNTFLAFDSQCRGFLTIDDLKRVFAQVAPHLPAHNIENAFREVDRDGDGRVSYADFDFMMKYSVEDGF